jgi:hypothetical protein
MTTKFGAKLLSASLPEETPAANLDNVEYLRLIVVNDGTGAQCAYSYSTRQRVAEDQNRAPVSAAESWATMAANAARWDACNGGARKFSALDIIGAAFELASYYETYIKES